MSQFSQSSRPPRRAPRVSLRGTISATIRLENGRQLTCKLHQLSITGGLLELAMYLEERSWVRLTVQVGSSLVHPIAEMMFPMQSTFGYLQPFRFTGLTPEERQILDGEIQELLKQTAAAKAGHSLGFRPPRFYLESF